MAARPGLEPPTERLRRRSPGTAQSRAWHRGSRYTRESSGESACKPGSVESNHSSGTHVAVSLERPTRKRARIPLRARSFERPLLPYLALLQVGFAVPPNVATGAVRSYRTVSPLPASVAERLGGLLSVALSVGSRPPGVTWHLIRRSPDFPPLLRSRERQRLPGRLPARTIRLWAQVRSRALRLRIASA